MNFNWPIIGDKIFGILKGSGFQLQMFDKTGAKTLDPHEATRFFGTIASHDPDLKSYNILISVHDENRDSHVDIKTPALSNTADFNFITKIKDSLKANVGDREGLSVNWYKFDHTIRPKDEIVNNITESKDISKPFGSTKSSYQRIGEAKLIIRHSDVVNEEKAGSRWRHVKSIFIENKEGERFKYPHMHIAGARAMARHVSNNGTVYDQIGEAIQQLSSDYMGLKKSARMLRTAGDESKTGIIREVLQTINKQVKGLSGPRGYNTISTTLTEKADIDDTHVNTIYSDLLEKCSCDHSMEESKYLLVAARYLAKNKDLLTDNEQVFEFTKSPDLISKVTEYTDQKERLAWQIEEMANCIADDGVRDRLHGISVNLKNQGVVNPDDIDLVRHVYKASKRTGNLPESKDFELDRIKTLSGI